ncbi:Lactose permease protein [Lasiodiplodia theobromae]|uniref:Lactose permease protein n=1 Tax=Lasiodiplodia theobromae TaxID=45133 RepID=UPI0015C3CD8B|nr:Lactose permease protein [Lasiodiplodia theobromae]KAF4540700.1 Lactose permease protein [Lasiodiplodia theobromae]
MMGRFVELFFCQQPRWNIHKRDIPWSIYMTHDVFLQATTYLVVCSTKQSRNGIVKERLEDMFTCGQGESSIPGKFIDPFMLHLTITQEAFLEAKSIITDMRYRLYDQLDQVDRADMANLILRRISDAHRRYASFERDQSRKDALEKTRDAINYLSISIESQLRWLASYKSRKDIAMNLVSVNMSWKVTELIARRSSTS